MKSYNIWFNKILPSLILLFSLWSCNNRDANDKALASFQNEALYLSDIRHSFPDDISPEDSLKLLNTIVENWVSQQLLYERAMSHHVHDEEAIRRKVKDYKQSLIIHLYKKRLISEKIDTTVTLENIKKYYKNHSTEFRLRNNIARIYFVKLPKSVPNAYKVRRWIEAADNEDKLIELKEYSYQNARYYEFDNNWIKFSEINQLLPEPISEEKNFLESYSIYQKRDSLYWYFLKVNEFMLKGDIPPMEYIIPDIKEVILSKRKIDFLDQLEGNLKREARNDKKIKINI